MREEKNKRGAKKRVLVVEDDEDNLEFLRTVVESGGHCCRTARTVAEAIAAVDKEPSDVILLDVLLPDGYGLQVARHVRKRGPRVKIVALSAYLDWWDPGTYEELGISQRIQKPYRVRAIRKALGA